MQVSLNNAHPNRRLGIGCVPWVGGARTFRGLNGVEAGLISGEMASYTSYVPGLKCYLCVGLTDREHR